VCQTQTKVVKDKLYDFYAWWGEGNVWQWICDKRVHKRLMKNWDCQGGWFPFKNPWEVKMHKTNSEDWGQMC